MPATRGKPMRSAGGNWIRGLLLSLLTGCALGAPPNDDLRLLDGLRQRGLFSLAELHCREKLAAADLGPRQRVQWSTELIRTYGQRAANSAPNQRDRWWRAAQDAAARYLQQHPEDPLRLLVQLQAALTSLAHGELARLEAEIAAQPAAAFEQARVLIRQAARELEQLEKEVSRRLNAAPAPADDRAALSEGELFSLQNHVRSQLARTYRNRALCYPPGSDDRVAALSLALQQIWQTLQQLQPADPLARELYLDLAICQRLLGNLEEAGRALAKPLADEAPAALRCRAVAEQARIELAAGRPEEALALLEKADLPQPVRSAEVEFAFLESYVALWQAAGTAGKTDLERQRQQQVTASVERLEQEYGAYWGRRGELLLLRVAGNSRSSGNVDLLERTADNLYLKGQHEQATRTYDQAARQATEAGQRNVAFDLLLKAALIQQKDGKYQDASRRLEQLALAQQQHPKAAQAHLLAASNAAQVVRADPEELDRYVKLLQAHVTHWPDHPTTDTARHWWGRVAESQQNWREAISAYQLVAPDYGEFDAVVQGAARCWTQWLSEQQADGRATERSARSAVEFLESIIRGTTGDWPATWTAAQRTAALAAARILVMFTRKGAADALELIDRALEQSAGASAAWLADARTLRIVALAGQPDRRNEARWQLRRLGNESPERLLKLIDGLTNITRNAPAEARGELARLQLDALQLLSRRADQLDPQQRRRIARLNAETLLAAGRDQQAIRAFQQLAAQYPDEAAIQVRFAELLLEREERSSLMRAADQWRQIARRTRPGTDAWFRAKYSIALAYFKLGDRAAAAQRLQYLEATSSVDQSDWGKKVAQLLQQCQ